MRALTMFAGLWACALVAGCGGSSDEAATKPQPKPSLARQAQMYAGQEQILSIQAASVERGATPGALVLKATGQAPGPGYTGGAFLPRVYAAQPPDGVYEVDVVAYRPAIGGAEAPTPIEVKGAWSRHSDDRVKGIKFITRSNELVAMVPPAG
jgi:hypothetical protein